MTRARTKTSSARPPRDRWERYYTPAWTVDRLLDRFAIDRPDVLRQRTWMEPACGDGAIVHAVDDWFGRCRLERRRWWLNDLRPPASASALPFAVRRLDFTAAELDDFAHAPVAITNPPYRLALRFAERMLERSATPILLLRLNWLEGAPIEEPERAAFLRRHPPDVYLLPNRPRFRSKPTPRSRKLVTAKGTDATAYAWMVWGKPEGEPGVWQLLDETPIEERKQSRALGARA